MSGWSRLVTLAERELALARGGDAGALAAAIAERAALAAALGPAPADARPELERLAAVQEQILVELTLASDGVARELAALRRGRDAVSGYRAASA